MIAFLMIAGLGVLVLLSRLAALTRMTIPLLYTVSMLTVFHGWYRTHTVLADRILFALVGLVVLSWLLSLIRFVCDLVMQARDDAAAMEYFSYRVRKARRRHRQHRGAVALNQPRPISSRMMRSLILIAPTSTSILKISSPT